MPGKILLTASGIVLLAILLPILAQEKTVGIPPAEQALNAKEYTKADSLLQKETAYFAALKNLDTLVYYVPLAGKIANELHGTQKSIEAVHTIISLLKNKGAIPALMVKACRTAADFFSSIGQNQYGYNISEKALAYTLLQPGHTNPDIAICEYNLGTYAHRLGNIALSLKHHRRSMDIRETDKNTDPEDIYFSANAMGGLMWYASKYDSAALLYNKALGALQKMPDNDLNRYFRPANIQNNLAALYNAKGNTTEAIKVMEGCIINFQQFIGSKEPHPKKQSATEGLFEAIDNLAGIYKEIGDYYKAGQLLQYSYSQKQLHLDSAHPGIFISEILLGQYYNAVHEYDTAMLYLGKGLSKLENSSGDYLFWAADGYYLKALIYANRNKPELAAASFAKSEELYETSYQGQYDNIYMDFLRDASVFYAKKGDYGKAFERADKVYKYLLAVNEEGSLQAFYQLLNIAEINYMAGRYKEAISRCTDAAKVINGKIRDGGTLLDSIKIEIFKPKLILINAKSAYELQKNKDTAFLKSLSATLEEALNILEKRKTILDDEASIKILIADHQSLIDFAKKIDLQLTEKTGNSFYLDRLINLHESALYNRIRGRLDKQHAVLSSGLPSSMQQQELELKKVLTTSLTDTRSPKDEVMRNYILATNNWEVYLDKVKKEYPAYYSIRYANLFKSLPELQSALPDSNTVVRYFFSDTSLMVLVLDNNSKELIRLENKNLQDKINTVMQNGGGEQLQLSILYDLYQRLWEPIAPLITNKKITIIPDGILYNLSFEMLTNQLLTSYKELASKSLLSRHIISYHYSLFMLGLPRLSEEVLKENYVAFAPGFSDDIKNKYLTLAEDSLTLDRQYLRLLPQPFTSKLASEMKKLLAGNVFLNEASTKNSFRNNAGGHKIIHIGTHATFNNIRPEQSGLIFTKNPEPPSDSNFLSLVDIYSCNMQSDLTILTACESGRPGYQDGEGMVSLAHAFNYAGSKRILTALWEIDEHSSSRITEFFIRNLKKGYPTDEALQQAKLQYLQQAQGRILAPAYWAGLVIIGEPSQLSFHTPPNYTFWIMAGIIIIAFLIFLFIKYRR